MKNATQALCLTCHPIVDTTDDGQLQPTEQQHGDQYGTIDHMSDRPLFLLMDMMNTVDGGEFCHRYYLACGDQLNLQKHFCTTVVTEPYYVVNTDSTTEARDESGVDEGGVFWQLSGKDYVRVGVQLPEGVHV